MKLAGRPFEASRSGTKDNGNLSMADADPVDPSRIHTNGWCQGAVCHISKLAADDFGVPKTEANRAGALAILISHDCDIVHRGTNEPVVEWLVAVPIAKKDRNSFYFDGRNPRRLHFDHHDLAYEIWARDRFTTPRKALEGLSAESDLALTTKLTRLLTRWLSKRYIRPAFPDAFNTRLRVTQEEIREALDDGHRLLHDLLIHVEPKREVAAEQIYHVSILGIMTGEDFKKAEQRESCHAVLKQLETYLAQCANVVVEDCELQSADLTPISVLDYYDPWDFDYLSVRDSE
jgi:hypothetical protein